MGLRTLKAKNSILPHKFLTLNNMSTKSSTLKIKLRYAGMLLVMLLAVVGCSEDIDSSSATVRGGLTVTISNDAAITRSIVIDNPGIQLASYWKEGDRIGVFGTQGTNSLFAIQQETIADDGHTAKFQSADGIPEGNLLAYYPYMENAVRSGESLQLSFPATQHYTLYGDSPQPDPEACVMVGSGADKSGISMHNVMAVLKIGHVFEENTKVKSVEFRDLSDKPVCGNFTVSLSGGIPESSFNGTGNVITLDMAEGVEAQGGSLFITFLVVPARDYPKGFEITFVSADGKRTTKSVGTRKGKTLARNVVHLIGDIGAYESVPGMSYKLKPNAMIMTPDKLEMIDIINVYNGHVKNADGTYVYKEDGTGYYAPQMKLIMHKDLNPKKGNLLIFNTPTAQLPNGAVLRIDECRSFGNDTYEVTAVSETNFAAPFETLQIGSEPTLDAEGNIIEDKGMEFDIAPYVSEIVEKDEHGVIISRTPVSHHANYDTNVAESLTRSTINHTYNVPPLTISMDDGSHCSCEVTTKIKLPTRLAIGIMQGELQYIYLTVNPQIDLKTSFALYGKYEKTTRERLFTIYSTGLPIGPIVLIPEIGFDGAVGVGGEIKFSASTTFNYNLGTYGVAYNNGQGLSFRKQDAPPPAKDDNFMPKLDAEISGQLYAFGSLGMSIGVSVYAMASLGLSTDVKLTFGIKDAVSHENNFQPRKLHLTPEIDIAPYTAFVGGKWQKVFKGLAGKIEFDPIWERALDPVVKRNVWTMNRTYTNDWKTIRVNDDWTVQLQMPTGFNGITYDYDFSEPTLNDFILAVEAYTGFMEFQPTTGSGHFDYYDNIHGHDALMSAGLIHLVPDFVNCQFRILHPQLVDRIILGTYKAGTKSQNFSGTALLNVPSGQPTYIMTRIYTVPKDYDFKKETGVDSTPWYNVIDGSSPYVWYYWPNNSNGIPYEFE